MSYKIVRKNEAVVYNPAKHYDMRATRLHNPEDVNAGSLTMGLSHFLPGGGCEYGSNLKESIYYIVEGEMDLEVEISTSAEVKTTLYAGDSFHCGPGTMKGIQNNGTVSSQMMVVLVDPVEKETRGDRK